MGYYNSFVIRIWSDEQGGLRGQIEHVTSRDTFVFLDPADIPGFIQRHLHPSSNIIPLSRKQQGVAGHDGDATGK